MALPQIPTDYLAYWPGTIAAGLMADNSANNNAATVYGGMASNLVGRIGLAAASDGTTQYARADFANAGDTTFALWVEPDNTGSDQFFFVQSRASASLSGRGLYTDAAGVPYVFSRKSTEAWQQVAGTGIDVRGKWTHLAGKQVGNTLTLYVNGMQAGTPLDMGSGSAMSNKHFLGRTEEGNYSTGPRQHIYVYPRGLSDDEIKALALQRPVIPTDNLVAAYDFADMAAGVVPDSAPGANGSKDGTVANLVKTGGRAGVAGAFNGASSSVTLPINSDGTAGAISFAFCSSGSSQMLARSTYNNALNEGIQIYLNSTGKVQFYGCGSVGAWQVNHSTALAYNDGVEHHLLAQWSPSGTAVYIDAVEVLTTATALNISGSLNWLFGQNNSDLWLNGYIAAPRVYSGARVLSDIALLATERPATPTQNLVADYTMQGLQGGVLVDAMGAHDGAIVGATAGPGDAPIGGGSLVLANGQNHKVTIPDHADFDPAGPLSIVFWAKHSASLDSGTALAKWLGSNQRSYVAQMNVGTGQIGLIAYGDGVNGKYVETAGAYNDGLWHCYIVDFEPSTRIGIDVDGGADVAENTTAIPASLFNSTTDVTIGQFDNNLGTTWDGEIGARVAFYNGLLSPLDKLALANQAIPYLVAGNILEDGAPVIRTVRIYNHASGALVGETQSDANGNYSFTPSSGADVMVVAVGAAGFRPLAHGPIAVQ